MVVFAVALDMEAHSDHFASLSNCLQCIVTSFLQCYVGVIIGVPAQRQMIPQNAINVWFFLIKSAAVLCS